ncbi:MAG: Uma2 family endonuclease [Blastocatellia bacterium]
MHAHSADAGNVDAAAGALKKCYHRRAFHHQLSPIITNYQGVNPMAQSAKLITLTVNEDAIVYPDSDGEPMAENTKQYQYIVTIQPELDALFADDPNVFVAADLFWYPVQGRTDIVYAPDTMVVFGRPKGHRPSYKQWEEDGIAPQVVFEIVSPSNKWHEVIQKRHWYEEYGVQEYYEYNPASGALEVWQREDESLRLMTHTGEWRSRRLGITLKLEADGALSLYRPDGRRFLSPVEQEARARAAEALAKQQQARAEREKARAEREKARAEREQTRAEQAEQEKERLAAKLRELGIDPTTLS